jgi:hypothetical protein
MVFAIVRSVSLDAHPEQGNSTGGQVSTQWLIFWGAIEGMVAIIVGCLPSFAISIRRSVGASRIQNYGSYPVKGGSSNIPSIQSSRQRYKLRTESLQLDELVPMDGSFGGESKRNLVHEPREGEIIVNQRWTQTWHTREEEDNEMLRRQQLGFRAAV